MAVGLARGMPRQMLARAKPWIGGLTAPFDRRLRSALARVDHMTTWRAALLGVALGAVVGSLPWLWLGWLCVAAAVALVWSAEPLAVEDAPEAQPVDTPPVAPQPDLGPPRRTFPFDTVTLDRTGREIARTTGAATGWAEELAPGVALEMIELPAGRFEMGAADGEEDTLASEKPRHGVVVPAFAMARFPVTQAQWAIVATWPQVSRPLDAGPSGFKGDDLPVECVSWHDAVEFCARLSVRTGRRYRLPSEAEWEYAARAGTSSPFAFGETITPEVVNYDGNYPYAAAPKGLYRRRTTRVGELAVANVFGLVDMHGNVWEWCQDSWHENYEGAPADGRSWEDGGDASLRVLRGGSWIRFARICRSAFRGGYAPDVRDDVIGFRVLCSVARTR